MSENKKAVLVTTEFRGVFFGFVDDDSDLPSKITLTDARNCINWMTGNGVFGLAATGPNEKCKIGPTIPRFTAWKITSVTECAVAAIEAWKAA